MYLTDKEKLIITIKREHGMLLHMKKLLDKPQTDNERVCVQIVNILCSNIPILEIRTWKHLGMTYDEVMTRRNAIMEERRRLKICKCGHSRAEHEALKCLICSCSNFVNPSGGQ